MSIAGWSSPERQCYQCGRELEAGEKCDCTQRIGATKDNLRARCNEFQARSSYRQKSYILCGGEKYRFESTDARNEFYKLNCCGACENCPIRAKRRVNK